MFLKSEKAFRDCLCSESDPVFLEKTWGPGTRFLDGLVSGASLGDPLRHFLWSLIVSSILIHVLQPSIDDVPLCSAKQLFWKRLIEWRGLFSLIPSR